MRVFSSLMAIFNCTFFLNLRKKMDKKITPTLFFLRLKKKGDNKPPPPTQHCVGNYVFGIPMLYCVPEQDTLH